MVGARAIRTLDISAALFRETILNQHQEVDYIVFDHWELDKQGIDWIIAWDRQDSFTQSTDHQNILPLFQEWLDLHSGDWRVGYLNYDLKNQLHPDIPFQTIQNKSALAIDFFVPKILFIGKNNQVEAHLHPSAQLPKWAKANQIHPSPKLKFKLQVDSKTYHQNIHRIQQLIRQNELHEVNYCIEWQANGNIPLPSQTYYDLHRQMQAPFSCYFSMSGTHLLCNSPERFLKKIGNQLITQPIKGTSPRFTDPLKDEASKQSLLQEKDLTENLMTVDFVRNDLSKIAQKGSVQVQELAQIYSFSQVHQLISTITCDISEATNFEQILRATFPMGSMTGAPKNNALEFIDEAENFDRGIYSGSVGYFDPQDDFDFNVVIRSLIYDEDTHTSFVRAGGAITADSIAENEWQECLLKAQKIISHFE